MWVVFYNKLSWFVSELPEKDISNVVVQCGYSTLQIAVVVNFLSCLNEILLNV